MKAKLILAPIRGVTTALYRSVYTKHFTGFDETLTPFIPTTKGVKISTSHLSDILPEKKKKSLPATPQLIGNSANDFIRMANHIHKLGYDTINWNLGCPFPTVVNKKRGAGLLPYPSRLKTFLNKVIPELKCELSIKVRLGLQNPDELVSLIPLFNNYPIKELIIHPRTANQGYSGIVDLRRYETCLALSSIPIVYSGDITDRGFFLYLRRMFPKTSAWMLGRGVLINPFLPSLLKSDKIVSSYKQPITKIKRFHDELYKKYQKALSGPTPLLGRMKELWFYMSQSFNDGKKLLKKIQKTTKIEKYENVVDTFFSSIDENSIKTPK